jgi:hypothetical protein
VGFFCDLIDRRHSVWLPVKARLMCKILLMFKIRAVWLDWAILVK